MGELLEPLIARGSGDICGDFSTHLPVRVFAHLARAGRAFNVAVQSNLDKIVKRTSLQLHEIARALVARRQAEPLDPEIDPTSALLGARHEGEPLPHDLLIGCIRQVLVVGIIAPTVMIGSIAVHLARFPRAAAAAARAAGARAGRD